MDVIGVRGMKSPKEVKRNRREKKRGVKVVYISSPMKVETSASQFRALVQELTGIHSDTDRAFLVDVDSSNTVGSFHGSSHPTVADDRKRQDGGDDQFGFFDFSMDQFGNYYGASLFSSATL